MNKFLIIAALTIVPTVGYAADMPVKAPQRSFIGAYPYEVGGIYFGVGAVGETERVDFASPIANTKTFAAGGAFAGTVGYTRPLSVGSWAAVEGSLYYANTSADGAGISLGSKVSGEVMVKYGGNLDSLSALIPNIGSGFPTLPTLPGGLENPLIHPYIGAGLLVSKDEADAITGTNHKTKARGIARVGFLTQKNNGTVIDTWAEWSPKAGAGLALPNFQADVGDRYRVGLSVFWGLTK